MVFYVVQWEEEESVSIVPGKDVLERHAKEGAIVSVITRGKKGQAQVYKASVLQIFATKAQALDFEKGITRPSEMTEGAEGTLKRKRKPSKKVPESKESDGEEDDDSKRKRPKTDSKKRDTNEKTEEKSEANSLKQKKKTKNKKEHSEEKAEENREIKLQASVQKERVQSILIKKWLDMDKHTTKKTEIDTHDPPLPFTHTMTGSSLSPIVIPSTSQPPKITPPTSQPLNTPPLISQPPIIIPSASQPLNAPPLSSQPPIIIPSASQPHVTSQPLNAPPLTSQPPIIIPSTLQPPNITPSKPPTIPLSPIANLPAANNQTIIPNHQNSMPQHQTILQTSHSTPSSNKSFISSSSTSSPSHLDISNSSDIHLPVNTYQNMLQDAIHRPDTHLHTSYNGSGGEWQSFSSTMTNEMERLKAEVENLKREVEYLKSKLRGKKTKNLPSGPPSDNEDETSQINHLQGLIKNTSKPFEGMKTLLTRLFTTEEICQSSLKGISGNVAMDKERIDLLYTIMEKRYADCSRTEIDKWIRGQQKKLRNQVKKQELKQENS